MKKEITIGVESVWLYSIVASYLMKQGQLPYHTEGSVQLVKPDDEDTFYFTFTWDEEGEMDGEPNEEILH